MRGAIVHAKANAVELSPDFVDLASPRPELSFFCKASLFDPSQDGYLMSPVLALARIIHRGFGGPELVLAQPMASRGAGGARGLGW